MWSVTATQGGCVTDSFAWPTKAQGKATAPVRGPHSSWRNRGTGNRVHLFSRQMHHPIQVQRSFLWTPSTLPICILAGYVTDSLVHYLFYRYAFHLVPAWQFIQGAELVFFILNSHWMCLGACPYIRWLTESCAFIFLLLCHQYCKPLWSQDLCRQVVKLLTFIACLLCAKHSATCFIRTLSKPYNYLQVSYSQGTVKVSALSTSSALSLSLSHTN